MTYSFKLYLYTDNLDASKTYIIFLCCLYKRILYFLFICCFFCKYYLLKLDELNVAHHIPIVYKVFLFEWNIRIERGIKCIEMPFLYFLHIQIYFVGKAVNKHTITP